MKEPFIWHKYIDWDNFEKKLYQESLVAIENFSQQNVAEVFSFTFVVAPYFNWISVDFETIDRAFRKLLWKESENTEEICNDIEEFGFSDNLHKYHLFTGFDGIPFDDNFGEVSHPNIYLIEFEDFYEFGEEWWEERSKNKTGKILDHETSVYNYFTDNFSLVFWKIFDKLINENRLESINRASLFLLGYCFDSSNPVRLRVLTKNPDNLILMR
jgi:hypothetical protein